MNFDVVQIGTVALKNGDRVVDRITAPALFGELALIENDPRALTAVADIGRTERRNAAAGGCGALLLAFQAQQLAPFHQPGMMAMSGDQGTGGRQIGLHLASQEKRANRKPSTG